jgi:hypothetical protein
MITLAIKGIDEMTDDTPDDAATPADEPHELHNMLSIEQTDNEADDEKAFDKLFTLDEAAALVPSVSRAVGRAQRELIELKESLTLTRRLMVSKRTPKAEQAAFFEAKRDQFERTYHKWGRFFSQQGIILRDLDRGLVDFPYQSDSTGEYYFLNWHQGDEGLFYFHEVDEAAHERIPISLLPE